MLHSEAVPGRTLALLRRLCAHAGLDGFALVGGTFLALRYGHRISVDLDFFRPEKFNNKPLAAAFSGELVDIYTRKFPGHDPMIPIRSMIYFEDAEETETPKTLTKTPWQKVKAEILAAVKPIL